MSSDFIEEGTDPSRSRTLETSLTGPLQQCLPNICPKALALSNNGSQFGRVEDYRRDLHKFILS